MDPLAFPCPVCGADIDEPCCVGCPATSRREALYARDRADSDAIIRRLRAAWRLALSGPPAEPVATGPAAADPSVDPAAPEEAPDDAPSAEAAASKRR